MQPHILLYGAPRQVRPSAYVYEVFFRQARDGRIGADTANGLDFGAGNVVIMDTRRHAGRTAEAVREALRQPAGKLRVPVPREGKRLNGNIRGGQSGSARMGVAAREKGLNIFPHAVEAQGEGQSAGGGCQQHKGLPGCGDDGGRVGQEAHGKAGRA